MGLFGPNVKKLKEAEDLDALMALAEHKSLRVHKKALDALIDLSSSRGFGESRDDMNQKVNPRRFFRPGFDKELLLKVKELKKELSKRQTIDIFLINAETRTRWNREGPAALVRGLERGASKEIKVQAFLALSQLSRVDDLRTAFIEAGATEILLGMVNKDRQDWGTMAATALGELGDRKVIEPLEKLLPRLEKEQVEALQKLEQDLEQLFKEFGAEKLASLLEPLVQEKLDFLREMEERQRKNMAELEAYFRKAKGEKENEGWEEQELPWTPLIKEQKEVLAALELLRNGEQEALDTLSTRLYGPGGPDKHSPAKELVERELGGSRAREFFQHLFARAHLDTIVLDIQETIKKLKNS